MFKDVLFQTGVAVPRKEQAHAMDIIVILIALPGAVISVLQAYEWFERRRKKPK